MKIPVDIRALLDEATKTDEAARTPLSVAVYIDETAPSDVRAMVRNSFTSEGEHARVSMLYFPCVSVTMPVAADMAVIVAGLDARIGWYAHSLRAAGIPTMVVTSMPALVREIAAESGYSLLDADVIAPVVRPKKGLRASVGSADEPSTKEFATSEASAEAPVTGKLSANEPSTEAFATSEASAEAPVTGKLSANEPSTEAPVTKESTTEESCTEEPYAICDDIAAAMRHRMGEWVVEACSAKRLAFALAFSFVRRPLAEDAVRATAAQNAGIGAVVILPGADMPIMTFNQMKMLLQIAAAYGQPLGLERIKELVALLGGAFACRSIARQGAALVPGLGWAVKAAVGYTGTRAMGKAAIEYFACENCPAQFADVIARSQERAVSLAHTVAAHPRARKAVAAVSGFATSCVGAVVDAAATQASSHTKGSV